MGNARLRLQQAASKELFDQRGGLLGVEIPRGRHAAGRGGEYVIPQLRPQRGRVATQRVRRRNQPGSGVLFAVPE